MLSFFQGKTILITGGSGFLASGVISLLRGCDCRILRLLRRPSPENEAGRALLVDFVGDLRAPDLWPEVLSGVDIVFYFAAQTSVYVADADPVADQAVNVQPMLHLLDTCRRLKRRPTVCFASTVTVAGMPKRLPVDENHPDHPLTVYDLHKGMAEQYLRWYAEQGFVRGAALRLANVYGPGPRSGSADRGILNQMVRRALAGEPLTVYGEGAQIRDYLYVEDAARAFLAAAVSAEALNGRHFIVGSEAGYTIAEAIRLVAERCSLRVGRPVAITHVVPPAALSPIEQRNFVADSTLFRQATGWRAAIALVEGIDRTVESLL